MAEKGIGSRMNSAILFQSGTGNLPENSYQKYCCSKKYLCFRICLRKFPAPGVRDGDCVLGVCV